MAQKLFTKKFGEIEVEQSWQEGSFHIARLTNGAYVHITGLPVRTKAELRAALRDEALAAAEHWFDHRHDDDEKAPRRIMFEADGSPVFEDGTLVESPSDLVQSLKPGPVLDAALMALAGKMAARKAAEVQKEQAGEKVKQAVAEEAATQRVAQKVATPKKSGMKRSPARGRTMAKAPLAPAPAQITV
jgi:hypothetical protein